MYPMETVPYFSPSYQGCSIQKSLESAFPLGYSPTTIYLYFRDKDDLLFTVVDEGFTRFGQQLAAAAASTEDPWKRVIALGQAYVTWTSPCAG